MIDEAEEGAVTTAGMERNARMCSGRVDVRALVEMEMLVVTRNREGDCSTSRGKRATDKILLAPVLTVAR